MTDDRRQKCVKAGSIHTAIICAVIFTGCGGQAQFKPVEQICVNGIGKEEVVKAAEDVFGEMAFKIDKMDSAAGYIKTRPLAAGQWFEFWRKDNVGAFNQTEANLHTIRRTAELKINEQDSKLCVSCDVVVQRLSLSEQPVSDVSEVRNLFSRNKGSLQRLKLHRDQKKGWVDLGNDEQLSSVILKQIESVLQKESKL